MRALYAGISDEEILWLQRHPNVEGRVRDALRWDEHEEHKRIERWHATYNAALTAICSRISLEALPLPDHSDYDVDHVDLHQFAWNCATQAHGEKP